MIWMWSVCICFSFVSLFAGTSKLIPDPEYKIFQALPCPLYGPWLSDPVFLELHESVVIKNDYPRWEDPNRYFQYVLSRNALAIEGGDFIECGVQNGKSFDIFSIVIDRWDTKNRSIYGFDSFEGLAAPTIEDLDPLTGTQTITPGYARGWDKDRVQSLLSYHRCHFDLVKGWIPKCFNGYENKRFCFAHIDVDLYDATADTIAFVYPRMLKGGIILFDDYGFSLCIGARKAINEYLADKPEVVIVLPTGQAFIIKQ